MTAINQDVFVDPTRTGSVGPDGWMYVCWKASSDSLQIFDNSRSGTINVRPVFEHHEDITIIEHGLGPHCFYTWCSQQGSDDGIGDLVFDDVRRFTLPIG